MPHITPFTSPTDAILKKAPPRVHIESAQTVALLIRQIVAALCAHSSLQQGQQWRSKWLALEREFALMANAALQPRAIVALATLMDGSFVGGLASEGTAEGLAKELMGLLGRGLAEHGAAALDGDLPVSLVLALSIVVNQLSSKSSTIGQLFWLGTTLLQATVPALYEGSIGRSNVLRERERA